MVGRGGFEPPNRKELSYSQPRLATSLPPHHWCRLKDLNPQPTDYKSVALPVELSRLINKKWWRLTGSNRWPSACKADALPTELNLQKIWWPVRDSNPWMHAWKACELTVSPTGHKNGAWSRTRTYDRSVNSRLLYQLSYSSILFVLKYIITSYSLMQVFL